MAADFLYVRPYTEEGVEGAGGIYGIYRYLVPALKILQTKEMNSSRL